jgi:hypothetical protein
MKSKICRNQAVKWVKIAIEERDAAAARAVSLADAVSRAEDQLVGRPRETLAPPRP